MARVANNEISNGYSDVLTIKHGDLTASGTTQTFTIPIPAGGIVRAVGLYNETEFDGVGASLTVIMGDGSDDNGFLAATQIHTDDGSTIIYANGTGAYIDGGSTDNEQQGKLYTSADTIDCLFTLNSGALSDMTQGKVHLFVDMKRLNPESV